MSDTVRFVIRRFLSLSDYGGLAQLARAPALQAGGQRFESVILHFAAGLIIQIILITPSIPITLIDHPHEIFDILTQARL